MKVMKLMLVVLIPVLANAQTFLPLSPYTPVANTKQGSGQQNSIHQMNPLPLNTNAITASRQSWPTNVFCHNVADTKHGGGQQNEVHRMDVVPFPVVHTNAFPVWTPSMPWPENSVYHAGHHYCLLGDGLTWLEAKKVCTQKGGHLAVFDTPELQKFALWTFGLIAWVGESKVKTLSGPSAVVSGNNDISKQTLSLDTDMPRPCMCRSDFQQLNGSEHLDFICEWDK